MISMISTKSDQSNFSIGSYRSSSGNSSLGRKFPHGNMTVKLYYFVNISGDSFELRNSQWYV